MDTSGLLAEDTTRLLAVDPPGLLAVEHFWHDCLLACLLWPLLACFLLSTSGMTAWDTRGLFSEVTSGMPAGDTHRLFAEDTSGILAEDSLCMLAAEHFRPTCCTEHVPSRRQIVSSPCLPDHFYH